MKRSIYFIKQLRHFILYGVTPVAIICFLLMQLKPSYEAFEYILFIVILTIGGLLSKWWVHMVNETMVKYILEFFKTEKKPHVTKYADFFIKLGAGIALFLSGFKVSFEDGIEGLLLPSAIQQDTYIFAFNLCFFMTMCGIIAHSISGIPTFAKIVKAEIIKDIEEARKKKSQML